MIKHSVRKYVVSRKYLVSRVEIYLDSHCKLQSSILGKPGRNSSSCSLTSMDKSRENECLWLCLLSASSVFPFDVYGLENRASDNGPGLLHWLKIHAVPYRHTRVSACSRSFLIKNPPRWFYPWTPCLFLRALPVPKLRCKENIGSWASIRR